MSQLEDYTLSMDRWEYHFERLILIQYQRDEIRKRNMKLKYSFSNDQILFKKEIRKFMGYVDDSVSPLIEDVEKLVITTIR